MRLEHNKSQSIIEYIVLISVVIAALLVFLGRGGVFEQSYNNVIYRQSDSVLDAANRIFF